MGNIMQTKMLFLCFLFLATFQSVSANCVIRCYAKPRKSLTSTNVLTWSNNSGSVSSNCKNGDKKKEACSKACADMMKTEPYCQTTIYLTGTAECNDPNAWMPWKQI